MMNLSQGTRLWKSIDEVGHIFQVLRVEQENGR